MAEANVVFKTGYEKRIEFVDKDNNEYGINLYQKEDQSINIFIPYDSILYIEIVI